MGAWNTKQLIISVEVPGQIYVSLKSVRNYLNGEGKKFTRAKAIHDNAK